MTRRRLLLDLGACQDVRNGDRGLGRAAAELAAALARRPGVVAGLLLNPRLPIPGHLPAELLRSPLLGWNTAAAVDAARAEGPIAYHLMSPFELSTPMPTAVPAHAVADGSTAIVVTLHDLIPLHDPERLLPGQRRRRYHQRLELVRGADLLLFDSASTRDEAVRELGVPAARCAVIGCGAADAFRPAGPGDDPGSVLRAALPELRRPFVLMVSGGDERKNTEGLIAAFARLPDAVRRGHQLVVACDLAPGIEAAWRACAAAAGLGAGEMVLTGFVPDAVLVALYQRAALTVMPSFDEGFGLPVAEAIACDAPVVTASTTSLPEILDLPESTFDPADVGAMAATVARGLVDAAYRERLLAAGRRAAPRYRWDAVADRALAALERLDAPEPRRGRVPRRPRIALVGVMPPLLNGVADYNARVCEELGRRADLDVLIPEEARPLEPVPPGPYRVLGARALGTALNPAGYDAVIHTFANNEANLTTYDLLRRFGGLLWLHDVRLTGFFRIEAHERHGEDAPGWMRDLLAETYGDTIPDAAARLDPFDRSWQDRRGILLTRPVVRHARAVLVNSRFAAGLVRLDQGPDARVPPIVVLPFGSGSPPIDVGPVERDLDPPIVASFGMLDWIKAPDALIESLARIRDRVRARLVFVGPYWKPHLDELLARAARLGVDDLVSATGTVDIAEWSRWLRRSSVVVQLRRITNGEMSGGIAAAQVAGVPVVTNIVNAALDLPDPAVLAIDPRLVGAELDGALVRLLTDAGARRRYSEGALAHAAGGGFDRVVDALLDAVRRHRGTVR